MSIRTHADEKNQTTSKGTSPQLPRRMEVARTQAHTIMSDANVNEHRTKSIRIAGK